MWDSLSLKYLLCEDIFESDFELSSYIRYYYIIIS